jgi:protein-S-isoprenylcysteine O-methyltransferase Ste14
MPQPLRCIIALWLGWLLIWLASAPFAARTVVRQGAGVFIADRLLLWGGAVLLMVHGSNFLLRPVAAGAWERWTCVAAVTAGLAAAVWARLNLGRNWSAVPALQEGHSLVRTGPYALVRHPIYTGLLLALGGTTLAVGTPAALAGLAVMAGAVAVRIRREETLMIRQFGDAYLAYRAEVPALIPRASFRRVR